ncbi:hypothetical protein [Blastococcus sp. TF02-09]|uniref:hypothetical protein n=1 Tax=Blastococcus sp. TF02-09 TaxID=2250576 RepID=UPI0011BE6955|nr:hypothetical protein [Blastococcus sp. TF02-9]
MRLLARTALGAVVLTGLVACGGGDRWSPPVERADRSSPPIERADRSRPPVELTAGDGCGDAFFWAATASGDVAVTISIDARGRSPVDALAQEFVLPDAAVSVEVLAGRGMQQNFCTDAINGAAEPRQRQEAVAGEGTIRLDPVPPGLDPTGCGSVSGELELTGLQAADGTTFALIQVRSDSIGCYSG